MAVVSSTVENTVEKLLLAAPRGYCAGVDRAVQTVERTLQMHGPPVYVRKEIVHNKHVVQRLRERGVIFVEQETDVPEGSVCVFSAHGVAPSVHTNAQARDVESLLRRQAAWIRLGHVVLNEGSHFPDLVHASAIAIGVWPPEGRDRGWLARALRTMTHLTLLRIDVAAAIGVAGEFG